ncbi:hypothetical protein HJG60_011050 [Phyllostomus discolor]|uniref:Uncharacterized protein n=1 Tax=Phyllostomus discolor TaxID=89673 RepID=A0A834AFB6_9CHIR|nr:hypothetical protein HJG60_011050 [Phyllostomus discolor]
MSLSRASSHSFLETASWGALVSPFPLIVRQLAPSRTVAKCQTQTAIPWPEPLPSPQLRKNKDSSSGRKWSDQSQERRPSDPGFTGSEAFLCRVCQRHKCLCYHSHFTDEKSEAETCQGDRDHSREAGLWPPGRSSFADLTHGQVCIPAGRPEGSCGRESHAKGRSSGFQKNQLGLEEAGSPRGAGGRPASRPVWEGCGFIREARAGPGTQHSIDPLRNVCQSPPVTGRGGQEDRANIGLVLGSQSRLGRGRWAP